MFSSPMDGPGPGNYDSGKTHPRESNGPSIGMPAIVCAPRAPARLGDEKWLWAS